MTNKSFLTGKRRQCVFGKAPDTSLNREQKGYTHLQTFALILQVHRAKNLIKRHENIHSWKERGRSIAEVEGAYFTKYLQKTMRENKIVIESWNQFQNEFDTPVSRLERTKNIPLQISIFVWMFSCLFVRIKNLEIHNSRLLPSWQIQSFQHYNIQSIQSTRKRKRLFQSSLNFSHRKLHKFVILNFKVSERSAISKFLWDLQKV